MRPPDKVQSSFAVKETAFQFGCSNLPARGFRSCTCMVGQSHRFHHRRARPFKTASSARRLPVSCHHQPLFFLSRSVAQLVPLFVLRIPVVSWSFPYPFLVTSTSCHQHTRTFASALPGMQKSSSMLFILGFSRWSCNVLEVRSAWPCVLAACTFGKSAVAASPSLWSRGSNASRRAEVGVLPGIVTLRGPCSDTC